MIKNCSYICGVLGRNILALMGAGIFISAYIGCRNFGLPIPDDFCTVRSEIVPSKIGDSAALFLCPYYNFSFMEGTMKNCKGAQGASKATSAHDTGKSVATVELPIISNPYSIATFLDFIAEATRHFDVEVNAKNAAYAFILSNGLYSQFVDFSRTYEKDDTLDGRIELILKNAEA